LNEKEEGGNTSEAGSVMIWRLIWAGPSDFFRKWGDYTGSRPGGGRPNPFLFGYCGSTLDRKGEGSNRKRVDQNLRISPAAKK